MVKFSVAVVRGPHEVVPIDDSAQGGRGGQHCIARCCRCTALHVRGGRSSRTSRGWRSRLQSSFHVRSHCLVLIWESLPWHEEQLISFDARSNYSVILRVCRLVRFVRVCGTGRERGERKRKEKRKEKWSSCPDHFNNSVSCRHTTEQAAGSGRAPRCIVLLLSRCTCINKGRERGEEEEEEEGERRRRFNFVPSSAAASAPNRKLFIKNKSKKPHKTHQTPRKHIKWLFVLGFFVLVGLVYFPWVGGFWIWNPDG